MFVFIIFRINNQLQSRNAKMARANDKSNRNFNKMQRNINRINDNINRRPASSSDAIKCDELNELYEFLYKFDGTLGETALTFRENVKNYQEHVYINAGDKYNENRNIFGF